MAWAAQIRERHDRSGLGQGIEGSFESGQVAFVDRDDIPTVVRPRICTRGFVFVEIWPIEQSMGDSLSERKGSRASSRLSLLATAPACTSDAAPVPGSQITSEQHRRAAGLRHDAQTRGSPIAPLAPRASPNWHQIMEQGGPGRRSQWNPHCATDPAPRRIIESWHRAATPGHAALVLSSHRQQRSTTLSLIPSFPLDSCQLQ